MRPMTKSQWNSYIPLSILIVSAFVLFIFARTTTIRRSLDDAKDTDDSQNHSQYLECIDSYIVKPFQTCWHKKLDTAKVNKSLVLYRLYNFFIMGKSITDSTITLYQQLIHDFRFHLNRLYYELHPLRSFTNKRQNDKQHDHTSKTTILKSTSSKKLTLPEDIQLYEKRIGRACDPSIDQYDDNNRNTEGGIDNMIPREVMEGDNDGLNNQKPYPGMILQIFPHQSDNDENSIQSLSLQHKLLEDKKAIAKDGEGIFELNVASHRFNTFWMMPCKDKSLISTRTNRIQQTCLETKMVINAKEYQLIEILNESLGQVDLHNHDYAYRPVVKLLGSSSSTTESTWFFRDGGSVYDYARMGHRAFAGGSHGEVWKARKRCNQIENYGKTKSNPFYQKNHDNPKNNEPCDDQKDLILKRIKVGKNSLLMEAGLREVYFGDILSRSEDSSSLFTVYVDHFFLHQSYSGMGSELWIVFENAGPSLRSYIYTPVSSGDFVVYQHSPLWRQLRMNISTKGTKSPSSSVEVITDYNVCPSIKAFECENINSRHSLKKSSYRNSPLQTKELLKDILYQIIKSASKLHERGIIHRDIKPSNIMCRKVTESDQLGINCVLGDFSSAWDDFSSDHFYSKGPTAAEQTTEYAPPEVLFGKDWDSTPFYKAKPESYDSWSIGVVILELLLGTPNVFSVDQRTTTLLTNKLNKEGASEEDIQRALYLAALSQFCIYVPTKESEKHWPLREGDPLFKASIVKKTCTINDFHTALRARDPLGIGFDKSLDPLLHLVWGLLAMNPKNRLTATEAMSHFYFTNQIQQSDREENALELQMLDPRFDMDIERQKIDKFVCPKCGRKFNDLSSCQAHATGRRHAKFCTYDTSQLPPCLNAHSMLPSHPRSGYCDIQGRRRVIEDFHTVHLEQDHQFFGIFDGHSGNLASKYAASELYKQLVKRLGDIDEDVKSGTEWKKEVEDEMNESFEALHKGVLDVIKSYPAGTVMQKSGTTATALFVTNYAVVVASVGDSRAVLSVGTSYDKANQASSIQLTLDHVAADPTESNRIIALGGSLESRGGVMRVNGTLTLTRSIGDAHLARYLSRTPNVVAMTKNELKEKCRFSEEKRLKPNGDEMPCFIILASDGLWDVISNQEAVDLVEQTIQKYDSIHEIGWEENGTAFQEAAEVLTQEAYVRGSSDNIGVCVVAIT